MGAVFGCLLAGFYLLRLYNMATATYCGRGHQPGGGRCSASGCPRARPPDPRPANAAPTRVAQSADDGRGRLARLRHHRAFRAPCALGAEVVWTRLMGMLLGSTVYVFSIILAVFLIGLALGSAAGSWICAHACRPRLALGWCQMLLAGGIAWTAYMIADSLPYWPINPLLSRQSLVHLPARSGALPVGHSAADAALGREFPAGPAPPWRGPARIPAAWWAASMPPTRSAPSSARWGSAWCWCRRSARSNSQRLLLLLSAVSALFVAGAVHRAKPAQGHGFGAALAASMVAAVLLARNVDPIPGKLIAYGRRMAISAGQSKILYTAEGRNSSVAITRWNDGAIEVDVNGHVEATTEPYDMKLQRMVGHLPGAAASATRESVLGIGFGAGVSAGTFTRYPGIEKHHRLRNRAGDPAHLHALFRPAGLRRAAQSRAPASSTTTRATTC